MDTLVSVGTLVAFASGFIGIGVGVGLGIYHFGLGWFISRHSIQALDQVIEDARRHATRRAERRHAQERRRRVLVENGAAGPPPRHLAR